LPPVEALIATIDEQLNDWNQGDVVLGGPIQFVLLADFNQPITPEAEVAAAADPNGDQALGTVVTAVPGFAVLTQSCDLVRSCRDRPFVNLAVLVEVEPIFFQEVKKGTRPRFAFVPGVGDRRLVADLHSITTIEKSVLAKTPRDQRIRGCRTDLEARELAMTLAHNLSRAALPDDFNQAVRPIQSRIQDKHRKDTRDRHGKRTNEGALLAALREIRVNFEPSRDAAAVELTFLFIFDKKAEIPGDGDEIVENLLKKFKPTPRFGTPSFRLVTLSEITAAAYLNSDRLDLDHLSNAREVG
jgi:hypothetical protein